MAMRDKLPKPLRSRIGRTLILVFLVLTLAGAAYGFKANYDPGPVSAASPKGEPLGGYASHAAFEKDCKHCHAPVKCLSANLCQDCHFEIAQERAGASGLHGLLPGTDKCQSCHKEHQGREAVISQVALANVDHERLTGFSLARHQADYDGAPLGCPDCHTDGRYAPEGVDCTGCHDGRDPRYMGEHTDRFGGECLVCHDGKDRMLDFAHGEVFALEGGHRDLACEACHVDYAFAGMSGECVACHEDPEVHAGEFGLDCSRCHGVAAWKPAQLTRHIFFLDHGGEGDVECEVCHTGTYVEHTCYGCHDRHQPGEMEALHLQEGIAGFETCADCHPTGQPGEAAAGGQDG
jgi:hypothetical protein